MSHTLTQTTVDGFAGHRLACPEAGIEATFVPSAGMVCCSLRHRGEELLGQRRGLRAYAETGSTMGIPLLHPWANRLESRRYQVAGRTVELEPGRVPVRLDANGLPIHGLLGGFPGWQVAATSVDDTAAVIAARLDFGAHERLLAGFPFPHVVEVRARLAEAELTIDTTMVATAEGPVPVAFGWHPYLRLPSLPRSQWEIELPVRRRARLDERGLPTGEVEEVEPIGGRLGDRTFDDLFPGPDPITPFALSGGGRRIEVALVDGYSVTQVYAPPDEDVVCYEPMTAWTNALASGAPALELAAPGERHTATFAVRVSA